MKVSIIAGVLLVCLVILVILNAAYIHTVSDRLAARLTALPEAPTGTTAAEITDVMEDFPQASCKPKWV